MNPWARQLATLSRLSQTQVSRETPYLKRQGEGHEELSNITGVVFWPTHRHTHYTNIKNKSNLAQV